MKPKKTVYYSDPLKDDFAGTNIKRKNVGHDFVFVHRDFWWKLISFLLYYLIAVPIVWFYTKFVMGLKIENRRALRKLRKTGYFLYGNHTQGAADAFIPSLITFPRRCDIVCGRETVSIPVIKYIVPMVGCIPLGSTVGGCLNFAEALGDSIDAGHAVTIYPEAHIWPYCNFIRNYPSGSFMYPGRLDVPAVGFTVTYRQRRFLRGMHPDITVTVGKPVYPDEYATRDELRDRIRGFMTDTVDSEGSYEYIKYKKK